MANAHLTQAKDIYQKLRSKLSALLSTLRQHAQNVLAKLRGNNS